MEFLRIHVQLKKIQIKTILSDIRFWLIVFFIIRLVGITNPPLEIGHNWRQSLTNMIARNFLEDGPNLLYPTIDMAGNKTGIIGSEFPFFNYLIFLVSNLFDYAHWYGRLINLTITSIGLFYFYKLIKEIFSKEIAFNATIILSTSIWFAFARKIMPDTFSVSLVIAGLYFGWSYLRNGKNLRLLLFFIFSAIGMLCKIPSMAIFSVIAIVLFIKEIPSRRKIAIYITSFLSVTIVAAWYFYWVPYLVRTYHFQLYFPQGILEGMQEMLPWMPELFEKFYFSALHSYVGFACCIIGIFYFFKNEHAITKAGIGMITLVFLFFILKTGDVFPQHNYYIIPFVPVLALMAGYFVAKIPLKFQYILLGVIAVEGIANQQHGFFISENQMYKLELEEITEQYIPDDDLIIINGGPSPQDIYFAHRKGWTIDNNKVIDQQHLDSLTRLGAKYLIIDRTNIDIRHPQPQSIYYDEHYAIYNINTADLYN